jgi:2-dehydro-3-deoxyphosphooctonate aldolase (KDO 8-P synthase)
MTRVVEIGPIRAGGDGPLFLIAGPCVIESEELVIETAGRLKELADRLSLPLIFKSSYDKANRSAIDSFRGPGRARGLEILKKVQSKIGLPVLSDVHSPEEAAEAAAVLDVLQIPAFLCRQTDLLVAAARTGKAVNVKKGQFLAPWDMANVVEKLRASGNERILVTERGVSFGYNNLVSDMRALPILAALGYPVVFDATHSVQLPGGAGRASGGERRFVPTLARAAVAAGCDGLFMEVHPEPDRALSDGPTQVPLAELPGLLETLLEIHAVVRRRRA